MELANASGGGGKVRAEELEEEMEI